MALSAGVVWEVRPTNGQTDAGGGFLAGASGTDRSQQDNIQTAFTDLVIGVTTTELTSAAQPFGASDVGNLIAITSGTGFTVGIYQVISVSVVTATMDRSVGTGGSTGGVGNLGGARKGIVGGTTTLAASLVAGNTVHVKNEAWNEAVNLAVDGSSANPITIIGYNTARNDTPTGTNRPVNNRASAAGDGFVVNADSYTIKNIRVTAAGDAGFNLGAAAVAPKFENCQSFSNTNEGWECPNTTVVNMVGCECNNNAVGLSAVGAWCLYGCYIHDNTGKGTLSTSSRNILFFCIVESNGGNGVELTTSNQLLLLNCTINGNTGASTDGVLATTPANNSVLLNNIFSNNGRDGVRMTDGDSVFSNYNDFYGNAGVPRTNLAVGANDSTLDPTFTDAANGDFSIGTNLKALGFPGTFPG